MADEVVTQEVPLSEATTQEAYKAARREGKAAIAVEKVPEPVVEEPEEKEEEPQPEEKPKVRGGFQKKIDKLTKEKAELEARAAAAERRAQELAEKGGKEQTKSADSDPEPKEEDFTDVKEYWKAIGRWTARQEMKAQQEKSEREEAEEQAKEAWEGHAQRIEEAKEKYDDFEDAVDVPTPWPLEHPTQLQAAAAEAFRISVIEDENSAELLYFYGTHQEEFAKLGDMTPAQVVKAIARQSDKLTGKKEEPKPKLVSKAPPPIHPVSGGATKSTVPLDQTESMAEYKKLRQAGQKY